MRFAEVAAERDYAAREAWEAEWDRDDPAEGVFLATPEELAEERSDPLRGSGQGPLGSAETTDDDGLTEAVIPTTDGPALVDLMRMGEAEWDAYTRGSAIRRAGYSGLRRNVAIALGNWLAGSDTPDAEAVGELVAALSDEDRTGAEVVAWGLACARGGRP